MPRCGPNCHTLLLLLLLLLLPPSSQLWGLIPGPLSERQRIWAEEVVSHVPDVKRRIFCNRSLNMKQIKVG
jgi:hypothetical protein